VPTPPPLLPPPPPPFCAMRIHIAHQLPARFRTRFQHDGAHPSRCQRTMHLRGSVGAVSVGSCAPIGPHCVAGSSRVPTLVTIPLPYPLRRPSASLGVPRRPSASLGVPRRPSASLGVPCRPLPSLAVPRLRSPSLGVPRRHSPSLDVPDAASLQFVSASDSSEELWRATVRSKTGSFEF
jgi:hypothetical protein